MNSMGIVQKSIKITSATGNLADVADVAHLADVADVNYLDSSYFSYIRHIRHGGRCQPHPLRGYVYTYPLGVGWGRRIGGRRQSDRILTGPVGTAAVRWLGEILGAGRPAQLNRRPMTETEPTASGAHKGKCRPTAGEQHGD